MTKKTIHNKITKTDINVNPVPSQHQEAALKQKYENSEVHLGSRASLDNSHHLPIHSKCV